MAAAVRTHGMSGSPEYKSWVAMKQRCLNPKDASWKNYGGRGIKVYGLWMLFKNFIVDVGLRPSPEYSLDRYPNNDGNYEPGNVRWATRQQQIDNQRKHVALSNYSTEDILAELAKRGERP
jgi:hypothetical protein